MAVRWDFSGIPYLKIPGSRDFLGFGSIFLGYPGIFEDFEIYVKNFVFSTFFFLLIVHLFRNFEKSRHC